MFKYTKAISSFSVDDIQKAREFYSGTLGVPVNEITGMGVLELQVSPETKIIVYPKQNHTPATYTVLNFTVADIEQSVVDLASAGVQFEHYDDPHIATDEKGISRAYGQAIAWFKDPAGNFASIMEAR